MDNKSIILEYEDGSVATLEYFAIGSPELHKEQLEVHFDEKSIIVEDYKSIRGFGLTMPSLKSKVPEKGQCEELEFLAKSLKGFKTEWPISLDSLIETTEVTLNIGLNHRLC
jgi:predicted dehydrogenase